MIGLILKGYQIVEKIKDGSVGTVWKATKGNQTYALKILAEKHLAQSAKVRQFKKEATLTQQLRHAHIIRVHEYHDHRPGPFFAMEYFDSENLKYAMWYRPERVYKYEFKVLRQAADALAHVHGRGVVHKDVKPENVLVNAKADVRLIDFSLGQTKLDRLLQFGRRVEGTPLYMAPEQIRGEKCDARTDIYAFGVMMYELLTKRPPFLGTTEQALLEKHLRDAAPPMRTYVKTLASELDAMVSRMLAKRPKDRFQDMGEVIYELSKWEKKDTVMRLRQVEPARPKEAGGSGAGR
jgi:serine/threonine-protein kinase